jgi:thiosulfate/3-mercaptopyruvate sulfurtransferase
MPNSRSSPFLQYIDQVSEQKPYQTYKPISELKQILVRDVGGEHAWNQLVTGERRAIFSCGSGMTACVGWSANELVKQDSEGIREAAVYDEVSRDLGMKIRRRLTSRAGRATRVDRRA